MQRQEMKILLLEDDEIIANAIKEYFELFDYKIDIYENGEVLVQNSNPKNYDILLLDINTPGISGLEVLETFRSLSINTPAIFITAMSNIDYIKKAYSIGCSDYIKKPFNIEELEIRINHIINKNSELIELKDDYIFNMQKEKLYKHGAEISLNEKERQLIYLLLKHKGETVSSDSIKSYIWEDKEICNNTLRTTIKKLRSKVDSDFIETLRGIGYKIAI